jgi:hypothetical protein
MGNPGDPKRIEKEDEVIAQESVFKTAPISALEVRSSHYSEEAE